MPESTTRWAYSWLRDRAFRSEALVLIRKALREGWPLTDADRGSIRSELDALIASGELHARQAAAAEAILAELAEVGR